MPTVREALPVARVAPEAQVSTRSRIASPVIAVTAPLVYGEGPRDRSPGSAQTRVVLRGADPLAPDCPNGDAYVAAAMTTRGRT